MESAPELPVEVDDEWLGAIPDADGGVGTESLTLQKTDAGTTKVCGENWGSPMVTEWAGVEKDLVDGFGLCSPNRWDPSARGKNLPERARSLCQKLHRMAEKVVEEEIRDPRGMAFRLAAGRLEQSPWSEGALDRFRKEWADLLDMPRKALHKHEGQPFYLDLMAQTLGVMGDPDVDILVNAEDSFATGVPVGYKEHIPPTPSVFPPKEKQNRLDESVFSEMARNYKSAEENAEGLLEKFREDEEKGLMYPTTLGALKAEFPDGQILVAALGAIVKPDKSVRPLHDGTHFVRLNNEIVLHDQLQYPGPQDAAAAIREARATGEAVFMMSGDISAAHRRVKIRKRDWPLLACQVESGSKVIWVNKVGTFGVSSAPFWWTRLFGLVGRLVSEEGAFDVVDFTVGVR